MLSVYPKAFLENSFRQESGLYSSAFLSAAKLWEHRLQAVRQDPPEPLFIVQGTNCFTVHRLRPSKLKLNSPMLATKRMLKTPAVDVPDMVYPIFPEPNFIVTNFVQFNIDVCCFITKWNGAERHDYYGVGLFWRQELRLIIGFRVSVGKEDWLTEDSAAASWATEASTGLPSMYTQHCTATVALKDVEANVLLKSAEITDFHFAEFLLAPCCRHPHACTDRHPGCADRVNP